MHRLHKSAVCSDVRFCTGTRKVTFLADSSPAAPSVSTESSLRERKRAASQATIEKVAITLALEHGYENVTVDMICEASLVSPRTFFNYFGSKEGVILGTPPSLPSKDAIERFVNGHDGEILGDFMTMFAEMLANQQPDRELQRARHKLISRSAELTERRTIMISRLEDQYVEIVMDRLRARADASESDLENEARMVIALATGVTRYASRIWFSADFTGSVSDLLASAINLVRRIVGDTASRSAHPKSTT
ncbi:TetR family transcriptional regulator [Cryobacterium tepidiphilum]|uniref:TetR family transcriptional regulator n=1 Tax=Cryobacterium tepidiphilum TaxID=2486026 RepID=A0A3M8LQB7_9MICO|nr:TetR family transcriptional regulator [Cryobacterium tepidiphilum]